MNKIVGHIESTYPCFSPYIHTSKTLGRCSLLMCHKLTFFPNFTGFPLSTGLWVLFCLFGFFS